MALFDPAAATAAYLAQLPPEAHAKATAYTQGGHWLLLWGFVVSALVSVLIVRWGVLAALRRRLERRKARPVLVSLVVGVVYLLVDSVLSLPWSIYADWWRQKAYGLTSQAFTGWLGEQVISTAIGAVLFGLFLTALYALIRKAPRSWWLWSGGLTAVFITVMMVLAPIYIEPIFNHYTPAPPGPVRDTVAAMARANGVPADKIFVYNGSKQSNAYTANVSGLFGSARVAMSDTMFKQGADLAEVRGVVGHEMGHYAHHHALWIAGVMSLLAIVAFFLVDRLFAPVAALMGGGDGQGPGRSGRPAGAQRHPGGAVAAGRAADQQPDPHRRERRRPLQPGACRRAGRPVQGPGQDHRIPRRHARRGRGSAVLRPPGGGPAHPPGDELEGGASA
jgi:STE24 endopeptidase